MPSVLCVAASSEPSSADWIAAIGQAFGAVFTLAAVLAALGIAIRDERRRHAEQERQALTQARLVRVGGTGVKLIGEGEHELTLYLTNHSERPILDVYGEAWPSGNPRHEPPRWAVTADVVLSGQNQPMMMKVATDAGGMTLNAWRVRWTDADGRHWHVDRRGAEPEPFTGQHPNPHE